MKFRYNELIDLGFERLDPEDEVWEAQCGFPYFIVSMCNEQYGLDWDIHTQEVEFQTLGKDYIIQKREKVTSLKRLHECIRLIKGTNPLSDEVMQIIVDFNDVYNRLTEEVKDKSVEMTILLTSGYNIFKEIKAIIASSYISEEDIMPLVLFLKNFTERLESLETDFFGELNEIGF